ncbi:sensor histidine kinase [Formosa sp. PL04]|uniref:sensor histidine kinase n=1 Tax=Formosa sp. PL04 TaxID=3081755 RepID=UPI002980AFE7|nr:histidine kinase [Formosa sp. PL04]MDW5288271.1 histidine kinase [Formosa sp. PL04]
MKLTKLILFLLLFPLIATAQGISILPSELPENTFGSWVNNKNEVVLIVSQDYLVINKDLFYYNQIVKENNVLNFTCTYNFDIKYISLTKIDSSSIILDEGYKITKLTKALSPSTTTLPISFIGNWYAPNSKLEIQENDILFADTSYKLDYAISVNNAEYYFVLYYDSEYYFAFNYINDNSPFININFPEPIVLKKESFFQKYLFAFIAFITLAFIILGYSLFKWKIALTKKREVNKRKFTEMQLKSIRSQMNPHFIFNALSAIQNLINKGDNDQANHYLTEFSQLLRLTLDKSEAGLVPLQDEIESIKKYLELEKLRFHFNYELNIDPNLDLQQTEIPAMLIQPFVENAILHGLIEKVGEKKLSLVFKLEHDNLVCVIRDNGIGIETAQAKKDKHFKREKYGVKLAKDRIDLINESYNTDAKITITDLSKHNSEHTGTQVEIYMPLKY